MSGGVDGSSTSSSTVGDTSSHGSTDSVDGSGEVGDSSSGGSDESSGGEPGCECDGGELLCTSFEPPFDPDVSPWAVPVGGGSVDPVVVDDPTLCGAAALRAAVDPGDLYSVINAGVVLDLTQPGPHRVLFSVWIEQSCLVAPTRVMLVQIPSSLGIWYQYAVWIDADWIELRLSNHAAAYATDDAVVPLGAQEWHTFELEFSLNPERDNGPPVASLTIDGTLALPDVQGPALSSKADFEATQTLNLGVYRDDVEFVDECAVIYDDVRVSTP
jgi:hypothetical protein